VVVGIDAVSSGGQSHDENFGKPDKNLARFKAPGVVSAAATLMSRDTDQTKDSARSPRTVSYNVMKAYLRLIVDGTWMQSFKSNRYRNKCMRFTAVVKSEDVSPWAGLWMHIDGQGKGKILCFDNMNNRLVKGSDWQRHQVVLDVPEESGRFFRRRFGSMVCNLRSVQRSHH